MNKCNKCSSTDTVKQISSTYWICFGCAVSEGKQMTDNWLSDYIEEEDETI